MIKFFTDGSSRGNPGKGGYGVVIFKEDILIDCRSEQFDNVTNNQMELQAILIALQYIRDNNIKDECVIYSDSAYCVNICNDWIFTWAVNNWKNSKKEQIKNYDLITQLYPFLKKEFPNYSIQKVSGHIGLIGNELADALATDNSIKFTKIFKENNIRYSDKKYDLISI